MLPPLYDNGTSSAHLEQIIAEALAEVPSYTDEWNPQLQAIDLDQYAITEYTEPPCWKLTMTDPRTGVAEPALIRLIGIISTVDFPPIKKPNSTQAAERMRPFLRQSLTLTGIQSATFHRNFEVIDEIKVKFIGALPPDSLQSSPPAQEYGNLILNMHNRYFTKASLVPTRTVLNFNPLADPDGHLDSMQKDMKYVHTMDNRVEYFQQDRRTNKTVRTTPLAFRPGDIVEVTVEFVAFPGSEGKRVFVTSLRGIKMITEKHRNTAQILGMRLRYATVNIAPVAPKRKALYADVDVEAADKHMSQLTIEDVGVQSVTGTQRRKVSGPMAGGGNTSTNGSGKGKKTAEPPVLGGGNTSTTESEKGKETPEADQAMRVDSQGAQ